MNVFKLLNRNIKLHNLIKTYQRNHHAICLIKAYKDLPSLAENNYKFKFCLQSQIKCNYIKIPKKSHVIGYLTDEKLVKKLIDIIQKDLRPDDGIIIANPSSEAIFRSLRYRYSNQILLFEPNDNFFSNLETTIQDRMYEHVKISAFDIINCTSKELKHYKPNFGFKKGYYANFSQIREYFDDKHTLRIIFPIVNSKIFRNMIWDYGFTRNSKYGCLNTVFYIHTNNYLINEKFFELYFDVDSRELLVIEEANKKIETIFMKVSPKYDLFSKVWLIRHYYFSTKKYS